MLQLKQVKKEYKTGDLIQTALDEVNLNLRDNEFVAILGPSGSGKTTLLNVIGGLDRYDQGDLIINSISTKQYKDRDWDSYRNHTVGFVFQNYNLIPHQTVLANVELALTISGISKGERKRRSKEALDKVGLGNQLHKKPNQMSGGQMQRVAIARALVNNPKILLADEPTGALDSETSVQIMELLKEVAKDRLVVMVTHNPELAEQYANRIVKLRDGKIIDDSNAFEPDKDNSDIVKHKNMGKSSMSFWTSISLSFNNLRTKKGRTLLTSFAGSIGIIGIALILALSTGVNNYIGDIQKDTMTSYPITISAETIDMASMMGNRGGMMGGSMMGGGTSIQTEDREGIYADNSSIEKSNALVQSITENDLTSFKEYLDDMNSEIHQYLGENGIVYTYDVHFDVYAKDADDKIINTNIDIESDTSSSFGGMMGGGMSSMLGSSSSTGADNFEELMSGSDGMLISQVTTDSYDVLYGVWPENYDEVVIVLDQNNSIPTSVLYQLGMITMDEYEEIKKQISNGEEASEPKWSYEELCEQTFNLVPVCDYYIEDENGTFIYIGEDETYENQILDNSLQLKVVGIIRPIEDAANATLSSAVAYTNSLTNYVIEYTNESDVVKVQELTPDINILNGLSFEASNDDIKVENAKKYIDNLNISDKASLYTMVLYSQDTSNEENEESEDIDPQLIQNSSSEQRNTGMNGAPMDENTLAGAMDEWIENTPDNDILLSIYDEYLGDSSYDENLSSFGKVSYEAPNSISIYADSFEDKDFISVCIENYNDTVGEDEQISYTDYVAILTSSITSIVNVITYVLIAFVAVSLVVSCIMIGIITHISVLERTKEIGILRAIGASKGNISQVFNAETIIIGLCAGLLGVGISELLTIPINAIIHTLIGNTTVRATLPVTYALVLVAISMIITVIGGLFPARKAAKKDPVVALRTE